MLVSPVLWEAVIHQKFTGYQLVQKLAHFQLENQHSLQIYS